MNVQRLAPSSLGLPALATLAAAVAIARVAGLVVSPIGLHGDEAQYWSWSQTFDWGYFSKPPLIAWTIAFTTALFGDAEWAVRLAAPITHALGAFVLGLLGRDLFGRTAGFWTGTIYLTMPAIGLSSGVMSTDALLLPIWSAALLALHRFVTRGGAWAIALGLAIGVGFLAKYAMIYFVIGVGLWAGFDREARKALFSGWGLVATVLATAIIAPNLYWNAAHNFATVSHTAANANWQGPNFRFGKLAEFLVSQAGVFGPITLGLLIAAVVGLRDAEPAFRRKGLRLTAFILPALLAVSAQAFITRANANWAAAAYTAATVLMVGWVFDGGLTGEPARLRRRRLLLMIALAVHVGFALVFVIAGLSERAADGLGLANAFKRTRGWPETTEAVREAYDRGAGSSPYAAVVVDNRLLFHGLEYYGREAPLPLLIWRKTADAKNHAETAYPLTTAAGEPVLIVSERAGDRARIEADFAVLTPLDEVEIDLGGGKTRRLALFTGYGFDPPARDAAYEARWVEGE